MGYTTKFEGRFTADQPFNAGTRKKLDDLLDFEWGKTPAGAPQAGLQWKVQDDNQSLAWDGEEKFYDYQEWLCWLIEHVLSPAGYVLNGQVLWSGDEISDIGTLVVRDNVVTVLSGRHLNADGTRKPSDLLRRSREAREAFQTLTDMGLHPDDYALAWFETKGENR